MPIKIVQNLIFVGVDSRKTFSGGNSRDYSGGSRKYRGALDVAVISSLALGTRSFAGGIKITGTLCHISRDVVDTESRTPAKVVP